MARIRTIKPEFFRHEALFEAEQETGYPLRIAFAGLWTASDREGRFQWMPRKLKLDCLPYDNVDFSRVLDALVSRGFIRKYASDNKEYGFIPSWHLHQVINNRESASIIPEPTQKLMLEPLLTCESRVLDACLTDIQSCQGEGNGREGKGREGVKPLVISDAKYFFGNQEKHDCPHQEIISIYHEVLPACPQIRDWTPARAQQLRARWNEDSKRQNLDWWRGLFEHISGCDFLVGKSSGKPFFATLSWITKAENFAKIREGNYDNRTSL